MDSSATLSTFEEKRAEARQYEQALSAWIQRRWGAHVLPTYDYSGLQDNKAPKLEGLTGGLVIPDLLVCRKGKTTWVECKWKTAATFHRKTEQWETGTNRRHYEHYRQVKCLSGCDVVILFLHMHEDQVRGGEIDSLPEPRIYEGDKMAWGGMVFWPWDSLPRWAKLSDVIEPTGSIPPLPSPNPHHG